MAQLAWPKTTFSRVALVATLLYVAFWILFAIAPGSRAFIHDIPVLGSALEAFFVLYFVLVGLWAVFTFVLSEWGV